MRARTATMAALLSGVALVSTGCGLSLQSLPKIGGTSGPSYKLDAIFSDVLNLPVNAQVRIGAEVVGSVSKIGTKGFDADISMSIKDRIHLQQGTTAEVRFDNPLGDEYVLLRPPPAPTTTLLAAGETLNDGSTSTAPSVEDTFGALSLVLNGGGIEQLQTVVKELNNTFTGNQPQIHALLGNIDTAVTSLSGGRVVVDNALAAIQGLTAQLTKGGGSQTIASGIAAAAPAVATLAGANADLGALLTSLNQLGTTGEAVAEQSGQQAVSGLASLVPVVAQLNAVDNQLQPDLAVLGQFEQETPKIAPGDYLQVSATANVLLPNGPVEASPGSTGYPSASGSAAVTDLLAGGLL